MRSAVLEDSDCGGGRVVDSYAEAAVQRLDGRKGKVVHAGRAGAWRNRPGRAPGDAILQRHAPAALLLHRAEALSDLT